MFNIESFMPHGHCFLWKPGILWTHVLSDAAIAISYFSIPIVLALFIRQKKDIGRKLQATIWMFVAFITLCGVTHLVSIWTMWEPQYYFQGISKALTAIASIYTKALHGFPSSMS